MASEWLKEILNDLRWVVHRHGNDQGPLNLQATKREALPLSLAGSCTLDPRRSWDALGRLRQMPRGAPARRRFDPSSFLSAILRLRGLPSFETLECRQRSGHKSLLLSLASFSMTSEQVLLGIQGASLSSCLLTGPLASQPRVP
jgi:hypothetical protein